MSNKPLAATKPSFLSRPRPSKDEFKKDLPKKGFEVSWITLVAANSKKVLQDGLEAGSYLLGRDLKLTKKFRCIPVEYRNVAKVYDKGEFTHETFDKGSKVWEEIEALKAKWKDKKGGPVITLGPEFLLWIPETESWGTFHLSSVPKQSIAEDLFDGIGKVVEISSKLISSGDNNFFGPTADILKDVTVTSVKAPEEDRFNVVVANFLKDTPRAVDTNSEG